MNTFKKVINHFEEYCATVTQILMIIVLSVSVISRYIFRHSISWGEELTLIFFVLSVYFGTTAAIRRNEHLRLTVVLDQLNPKNRLRLLIVDNIIFMVFNAIIITGIWKLTCSLYNNGTVTAVLRIPKAAIYIFLPFLFIVMIIRLVQDCIDKAHEIRAMDNGSVEDGTHTTASGLSDDLK